MFYGLTVPCRLKIKFILSYLILLPGDGQGRYIMPSLHENDPVFTKMSNPSKCVELYESCCFRCMDDFANTATPPPLEWSRGAWRNS